MRPLALNSYIRIQRVLILLMVAGWAAPSYAAPQESPVRQQFEETYQRILKNPKDRALSLQYAALAMQLKDYEAAIPPLERILMSEPDNAKIKVQLGVLYQALGSKLMAKQYFLGAQRTPGVTPEIARQAEDYLHAL